MPVLTEGSQKSAKVIDLSYGGVALQFDKAEDLPSSIQCRAARADSASGTRGPSQGAYDADRRRPHARRLLVRFLIPHT